MILKPQDEIEIAVSEGGHLVIAEKESEQAIYLSPDQAVCLKVFIEEKIEEMNSIWYNANE